jgi:hypothetical protein
LPKIKKQKLGFAGKIAIVSGIARQLGFQVGHCCWREVGKTMEVQLSLRNLIAG